MFVRVAASNQTLLSIFWSPFDLLGYFWRIDAAWLVNICSGCWFSDFGVTFPVISCPLPLFSEAPQPPWENQLGITKLEHPIILLEPKNGYSRLNFLTLFICYDYMPWALGKGLFWWLLIAFKTREIPPLLEEKMPRYGLQTLEAWMSKGVKHISETV